MRSLSPVLCILFFAACNKTPVADFSINRETFSAGETVELRNASKHAKTCLWTLPDGQTSSAWNVDYTLNGKSAPGKYKVRLRAISKKGDKSDETEKVLVVQ